VVIDGDIKIMALFDGHGDNGHFVSNFVMGCMLDYLKNAKVIGGKTFMQVSDSISDQEVTKLLKNAFKYT
jgi:serine/threonine protein phosphatase PrpC